MAFNSGSNAASQQTPFGGYGHSASFYANPAGYADPIAGGPNWRAGRGNQVFDPRNLARAYSDSGLWSNWNGGEGIPTGGGVDPWSTDTRPPLFWSEGAPNLQWDLDLGSLPRVPGADDFSTEIADVEQATFDRMKGLLDPVFGQREIDMNESLANRGLPAGSSVNAITRNQFGRDYADAYERAALDSVGAGRQEHSRLYGMGLSSHQQALEDRLSQLGMISNVRGQAFGEQMGARGQLFQELMGSLGMSNFDPMASLTQPGIDPSNFLAAILGGGQPGSSTWSGLGGALGGLDWASIFGGGGGDSYLEPGSIDASGAASGTNAGSVYDS